MKVIDVTLDDTLSTSSLLESSDVVILPVLGKVALYLM